MRIRNSQSKYLVLLVLTILLSITARGAIEKSRVKLQVQKDYATIQVCFQALERYDQASKLEHNRLRDNYKDAKFIKKITDGYQSKTIEAYKDSSLKDSFLNLMSENWGKTLNSFNTVLVRANNQQDLGTFIDTLTAWQSMQYKNWFSNKEDSTFLEESLSSLINEGDILKEVLGLKTKTNKAKTEPSDSNSKSDKSSLKLWPWLLLLIASMLLFFALFLGNKFKTIQKKLNEANDVIYELNEEKKENSKLLTKKEAEIRNLQKNNDKLDAKLEDSPKILSADQCSVIAESVKITSPVPSTHNIKPLYSSGPSGNIFKPERFSNVKVPGDSIYEIKPTGEDQATVKFIADSSIHYRIIMYQDNDLLPVCTIKNKIVRDEERIRHVTDGTATKEGDNWRIKDKVIVEFI